MNNGKLKIRIYGEPYEWAMAYNLKEAFHQLGHEAVIFDWTQWLYRSKKYTLTNRVLDRILVRTIAKKINSNFISFLKKGRYDLMVVMKGLHISPESVMEAKKYTKFVVNWNPDDFFNPLNNSRYLLESFDKYDCIFTPRKHLIQEYYKKKAKRVGLLNWYYLPNFLRPVEISLKEKGKYASDLVFIGTWSKRRENILNSLRGFNLKIWGSHWCKSRRAFRRNFECNNPIFMEEMCKVINASKINLNILTKENRDTTNIRNFEIPACGGFQLSERSNEILEMFEEDKEIVCFETVEELISKCDYYLKDESERERIRLNGYRRLISGNHTMLDRAREILDTVFD